MKKIFISIISIIILSTVTQAEEIILNTEDGFKLPATLLTPQSSNGAGLILIHQGGSDRSEWAFMHNQLLEKGYVLLSYDIRGMGASPKDNGAGKAVENIYNSPHQAPLDLKAAITYLEMMPQVDNERIGILGASVGGNLAVVGSATMNIKSAVSISGKTEAVQNLAGTKELSPKSIYFISSMESDCARAKWAEEMYNMTDGPREIAITAEMKGHGVTILHDNPILQGEIVRWFQNNL